MLTIFSQKFCLRKRINFWKVCFSPLPHIPGTIAALSPQPGAKSPVLLNGVLALQAEDSVIRSRGLSYKV